MRRVVLLLLLIGCRKTPRVIAEAPPPENPAPAEAPAQAPAENPVPQPPTAYVPPPPPMTGHAPTSDEVRARLQPLFPDIAHCVTNAGTVDTQQNFLQLRFIISSATGGVINAELQGHERARDCTMEALRRFHVEPWTGPPSTITLPLNKSGEPVPESTFTDAGA